MIGRYFSGFLVSSVLVSRYVMPIVNQSGQVSELQIRSL